MVHAHGIALDLDIYLCADLPVHAPDAIRLRMDEDGLARVGGMVEEKARLGRRLQVDADVGDQEVIAVGHAGKREVEQLAHAAASAITGQNVLARKLLLAGGSAYAQSDHACILAAADYFMIPTHGDERGNLDAVQQVALDVILLQIEKTWQKPGAGQRETLGIQLALAKVGVPDRPGNTFRQHGLRRAQLFPGLQCGRGIGDGARAFAQFVVIIK